MFARNLDIALDPVEEKCDPDPAERSKINVFDKYLDEIKGEDLKEFIFNGKVHRHFAITGDYSMWHLGVR